MEHSRFLISMLTETAADISSDEDSDSSWSDVCSLKQETDYEDVEDSDESTLLSMIQCSVKTKRKRVDDYFNIVESWTDSEFRNKLRISKKTANQLIDELEKSGYIASHTFGSKPLEPRLCFYIFLSFITNTETLTPIATRYDISISSAFRVIRRVVAWILTKLNDAIKWPENYIEVKSVCDSFYAKTGLSDVLGVIDTTHIKIEKPKNGQEYFNSKGYYSIILQVTVDSKLKFINVYCGEPGSTNCARVLKRSPLYNTAVQHRDMLFPQSTILLGHSRYPTLSWLLPPFRENKRLSVYQKEFNSQHLHCRRLSEKAFNLLKGRFRRIKVFNVYRNLSFITDTVVAACILHNYCLMENDYLQVGV